MSVSRDLVDALVGAVLVFVLATALGLALAWLAGCASFGQRCRYDAAGRLVEQATRSLVIGTGETELVTSACAALSYATQGTGLSDNGRAALGTVAEGAVAGALP